MKKHFFLIASIFITVVTAAQDSAHTQLQISSVEELKLLPTLWQQNAAEYRALCYQAFNIARLRIDEIPKRKLRKGKLAIITDLDETILDNSPEEAQLIKDGKLWNPETWNQWTNLSAATALPGAVEFLQYAKQKGVTIFYISNRDTGEVTSTVINLKKLNLPDADTSHCMFMQDESSKELRRQTVMQHYNVVMLLGYNLNDFTQAFEKKNIDDRFTETDKAKAGWGKKFIVLPNATYGEWENALYNYKHNLSPQEQLNILRALLKGIDKAAP